MLSFKYAECRKKPIMMSIVMLSVIVLSVDMLSVVMIKVVAPNQALAKEECIIKNTTDNGTTCFLELSIIIEGNLYNFLMPVLLN
jgi:hypothetical protein